MYKNFLNTTTTVPLVRNKISTHLTWKRRVFLALFILSFALDFKGEAGGTPFQLIMAGLNSIALLSLFISYRGALPRKGLAAFTVWGWLFFLWIGIIGAVGNGVIFARFIRVIYPFFLFLAGFMVAWWSTKTSQGADFVISLMWKASVISVLFTFWWGQYFSGKDIGEIRYQILSPLLPFLIVVSSLGLVMHKRKKFLSVLSLIGAFTLIYLSITRGVLLSVSFVIFLVFLAAFINLLRSRRISRSLVLLFMGGTFSSMMGMEIALRINSIVLSRWISRALGESSTVTFWTRIAAIVGQLNVLKSSPFGWITGQGFGSSYPWPVEIFPWILPYLGSTVLNRNVWFPGEFMWIPFFFYGGVLGGGIATAILLAGMMHGYRLLFVLMQEQWWKDATKHPFGVGILGYFVFLGIGFTGNPFIFRLAALFMGLCLGLIVNIKNLLQEVSK